MSVFENEITAEQAEASTKHYTPSVQEIAVEEPSEPADKTPITAEQRESLDKASESTFQSPFGNNAGQGERSVTFIPQSEWVSPVQRQRQRSAMTLPSRKQVDDLDQRVSAVMRFDGAPKEVATAAQKARLAVGAARQAHEAARHPDNGRYAANQAVKDAVIQEIAKATVAVAALEQIANRDDVREQWFNSLVSNLDKQRTEAAKALDAAAKAYAAWRQSIAAADALAKEQGRWGDWHHHPQERELNALGLIGEIRNARDIAKSEDDFVNGDYLTKDYGNEIPPHTMAYLERSAQVAGGGSYAQSVLARLKSPHSADLPAQDSIRERDLRIIHLRPVPALNPEQALWDEHARLVDPAQGL